MSLIQKTKETRFKVGDKSFDTLEAAKEYALCQIGAATSPLSWGFIVENSEEIIPILAFGRTGRPRKVRAARKAKATTPAA